jgi:hypothetical protein
VAGGGEDMNILVMNKENKNNLYLPEGFVSCCLCLEMTSTSC